MVREYSLDKYRKEKSTRAYHAFATTIDSPIRLKIMPVWRAWEHIHYAYLVRVVEDGFGTEIVLVYTSVDVIIKGSNLDAVVDAIAKQKCEFVQEFDKDIWDSPEDKSAPFIDSIAIYAEIRDLRPKNTAENRKTA